MKRALKASMASLVAGVALLTTGCGTYEGGGYTTIGVGYGYPYYGPGWGYYPYPCCWDDNDHHHPGKPPDKPSVHPIEKPAKPLHPGNGANIQPVQRPAARPRPPANLGRPAPMPSPRPTMSAPRAMPMGSASRRR